MIRTLCLGLLTLGLASAMAAPQLEPVAGLDSPWREINAGTYKAKIYGSGRFDLDIEGCGKIPVAFIQCWRMFQTSKEVSEAKASALLEENALSAKIVFSYHWNDGEVLETLLFTSRSISVSYDYRSGQEQRIDWLNCHLRLPDMPALSGGLYRFDETKGTVGQSSDWKELSKRRFSSLSLGKPWSRPVDILAEGEGWLGVGNDKTCGQIFLWPRGRWSAPKLPAGETLHLALTLWLYGADGNNMPLKKLEIKSAGQ